MRVRQFILSDVAFDAVKRGLVAGVQAVDGALVSRVQAVDGALVARLQGAVRGSRLARSVVSVAAERLATVEVLLMIAVALSGRRRLAARMLGAVGVVFALSEVLGTVWRRERPFSVLAGIEALAPHTAGRSFPSRHVASGLAMAALGRDAHPRLGDAMAVVAWSLGLSRIAVGLHYPSDIAAGALLGTVVGRLVRP